jgi:hypothetical protein
MEDIVEFLHGDLLQKSIKILWVYEYGKETRNLKNSFDSGPIVSFKEGFEMIYTFSGNFL